MPCKTIIPKFQWASEVEALGNNSCYKVYALGGCNLHIIIDRLPIGSHNPTLRLYTNTGSLFQKDMCTSMLTAVLFAAAKIWKSTRVPWHKWIKTYLYTQWNILSNEIKSIAFCSMDQIGECFVKWNTFEGERQRLDNVIHKQDKKNKNQSEIIGNI